MKSSIEHRVPEQIEPQLGSATVFCEQTAAPGWNEYLQKWGYDGFHLRSQWGTVFSEALRHRPWFLRAERDGRIEGVLPLMLVSGPLFGRFLVSQPYLNTGGVLADSAETESLLVSRAVQLADSLQVRHLELRHERLLQHEHLNAVSTEKVHMRMALPATTEELWQGLKSKVRNRIRKPLNDSDFCVRFGHLDQLDNFYSVFCRNMRDLGTPVYPKSLFRSMLNEFPDAAEVCTVFCNHQPVASGILLHGPEVTHIPSAGSLREFNQTNCNTLLYWNVLCRSVERGQTGFDFGRSTPESGTWRFKRQWGAEEFPAVWQYFNRIGSISDVRPNSGRYDQMIRLWQRLPVWLTRLIGPPIVRGIP
ncbi:MAG: FemAB family PEP-CTERM system-associated protein [Planctomycetaceae bacterium]|nr:FemAB family PEP-CTERM system-associated protein [Planctomycetaceae bacterium]